MLGLNKGRAKLNDFDVVILHQRKILVSAAAADATRQSCKAMLG